MPEFKDNLFLLRQSKRLSRTKLSHILGFGDSTIALYETGRVEPTLPKVCKIADYFHVTMDSLVGREDISQTDTQQIKNALSKIYQSVKRIEEKK